MITLFAQERGHFLPSERERSASVIYTLAKERIRREDRDADIADAKY